MLLKGDAYAGTLRAMSRIAWIGFLVAAALIWLLAPYPYSVLLLGLLGAAWYGAAGWNKRRGARALRTNDLG